MDFRGLFHKVKVFYKGKPFPVRGNITMDFSIVEFGKIRPKIGEEVEIINEQQRFSDLAKVLETIPYEIMTKIGERVKRVHRFPRYFTSIFFRSLCQIAAISKSL